MIMKNNYGYRRNAAKAGKVREIINKYGRIVFEQTFSGPDGKEHEFILFNATQIPAIVFPLTPDNKVVAVRQFRYGANDFVLEIPGGNSKKELTPEECAKVEIMEETGYAADKIVRLGGDIWFDPASSRARYAPLLALGCRRVKKPKLDSAEIIETVEVPLDEWFHKVRDGKEILDSKTLAVTVLALLYLNSKAY